MSRRTRAFTATLLVCFCPAPGYAGSVALQASGDGGAYALIDHAFADGGSSVEVPDCGHPEFGPHITQGLDPDLKRPVFRFHIHRDADDDRCRNSDRQRTEIKVYAKSPEALKAKPGDVFTYSWKFRLGETFQPSRRFTHLHQIKAVGGSEDAMPLVTLTARKGRNGGPDRLELRHATRDRQRTLAWAPLQPFLGRWISVTETIAFGETGKLRIRMSSAQSGQPLLEYESDALRMWKSGADFVRPKWGIYRSLKDRDALKDETVGFADFRIDY